MKSAPPLLSLMQGRRVRARRAPRHRPLESVLHKQVADLLRQHCLPSWRWTHIASGELRDIRTATKLKAMGVRRGWPDFILLAPGGQGHGLELKRQGEHLTDDQIDFQMWSIRTGSPYSVARSIGEVHLVLDAWKCCRTRLSGGAG
jgi:hypothetical protein